MSEPTDHHYLPKFFLKRWANTDGRVCSWKRLNRTKVAMARVAPKHTAYEPDLYSLEHAPEDEKQIVERQFFSKVDSDAAIVLSFIEGMPKNGEWSSDQRSMWSRFLMTQMMRLPADITQLKSSIHSDWSKIADDLQPEYAKLREDGDPEVLAEFLREKMPGRLSRQTFQIIIEMMSHAGVGQILNNLIWVVADMQNDEWGMITADRPIWSTATFNESGALLLMPISRSLLFIAAPMQYTIQRLLSQPRSNIVKNVNRLIARHADKRAYSFDDRLTRFMENNLAVVRHVTWAQRLAMHRGHNVVPR